MNNRNELLLAVKDARRGLNEGKGLAALEMLALLEGMAPFMDKSSVIEMKCSNCDHYAQASFTLDGDFLAAEESDYCHACRMPMQSLSLIQVASCPEHSGSAQKDLSDMASSLMEEDLRPAFSGRKLYDRSRFASYSISFRVSQGPGRICIEFGHKINGEFVGGEILLYILRRLDPGFGPEASQRIAEALKSRSPVMVVKAGLQTRRLLDIDYVLEWVAKKRKMDIVYL